MTQQEMFEEDWDDRVSLILLIFFILQSFLQRKITLQFSLIPVCNRGGKGETGHAGNAHRRDGRGAVFGSLPAKQRRFEEQKRRRTVSYYFEATRYRILILKTTRNNAQFKNMIEISALLAKILQFLVSSRSILNN